MKIKVIATGSNGNCYAVYCGNEIILLDCGVSHTEILKGIGYKIRSVVGVIVTHHHADHSREIKYFLQAGIPVYGNAETAKKYGIEIVSELRMRVISKFFAIYPYRVPHTSKNAEDGLVECENYGYVIFTPEKNILYMTDFEYCKYSFRNVKIHTFLIECNYCLDCIDMEKENFSHVVKGHASLGTVSTFLSESKNDCMENIILCHLSQINSDENEIVDTIEKKVNLKPEIAKKGREFTI